MLGYHPKASKSWLIVKENRLAEAKKTFSGTNINITTDGKKYLGGFIGTNESRDVYSKELVDKWVEQLCTLSNIAKSEPQAAYAAFVSGFQHKLTYHIHTIPNLTTKLTPLDHVIDQKFIPAITDGHVCSEDERRLLSLPVKMGGLGIPIFAKISTREYENSKKATTQLANNIKQQTTKYEFDQQHSNTTKREIVNDREKANMSLLNQLRERMDKEQIRANDLAKMKGSSSWLTTLPLRSENFVLNKREFFDAVSIRYRWQLKRMPNLCSCGKPFDVDHAMSCFKGGFIHQRHDQMRDMIAQLMSDIYKDVQIEPHLTPLTGEHLLKRSIENDEARLDISARSFWIRGQKAYFDVRVFNPFAKKHLNQQLPNTFVSNEKEKKRSYNERVIEVEHGSFTPLIFTPYGGCSRETEKVINVLATGIAEKRDLSTSIVTNWIRTKLSFTLLNLRYCAFKTM